MILHITYSISTTYAPGFIGNINNQTYWFLTPESDPENLHQNPEVISCVGANVIFNKPLPEIISFLSSQGFTHIFDTESGFNSEDLKVCIPLGGEDFNNFFESVQ